MKNQANLCKLLGLPQMEAALLGAYGFRDSSCVGNQQNYRC